MIIKNCPPSLNDSQINIIYNNLLNRLIKNNKLFHMVLEDKKIKIHFKTLGVIAGEAKENNLNFNYELFNRQPELFEENFAHELAHSICHFIYKRPMGHGKEWQKVMKALEVKGSAFHHYNVEDLRLKSQKVYSYKCQCRNHKISSEGHEYFKQSKCICKFCKTEAILQKESLKQ